MNYPDNIICALFRKSNLDEITTNQKKLHEAVYELKRENPGLFKEFTFSKSGTFPYSNLLERVIQRLITSDILITPNPKSPNFKISLEGEKIIDESIIVSLIKEDAELIETSGRRFAQLVS